MGLSYRLRGAIIEVTTRGDVDYDVGFATLQQAFADAGAVTAREPGTRWHCLFDITESTEDRTAEELRGIADYIATHRAILTGRVASAVSERLYYGLSRMFAAFMDDRELSVEVFDGVDAAEAWLVA